MKTLFTSSFAFLIIAATQALASNNICNDENITPPDGACPTPVPEISAMEGTAALAAIAAILLITWERRRRAAA